MRVFIFKLIVTALLLWLLFSAVDLSAVVRHVGDVSWYTFVFAALCSVVATLLSTIRWSLLLRVQGISLPFMRLVAYNLSYTFYSIVLPGGKVSAEGVRVYQVMRDTDDEGIRNKIIFPTLLDRAVVVFSSAFVAAVFFLFTGYETFSRLPVWFPYAAVGLVVLITLSVFLPFERLVAFLLGTSMRTKKQSALTSLKESLAAYRSKPLQLTIAVLLTFVMLAVMSSGTLALASAMGAPDDFLLVCGVVSASMVAAFLPLTIGGIGVREGVFAYMFSTAALVPLEIALSISLLALFASHVVTLFGGLVEFRRHFIR